MQDFAKAGAVAERSVTLQPGEDPLQYFPVSMFNLFRKCVVFAFGVWFLVASIWCGGGGGWVADVCVCLSLP